MSSHAPVPPQPSSAGERQKLIAEYEESLRSASAQRVAARADGERRRSRRRFLGLLALVVLLVYLAFLPPAWFQPAPLPVPTAEHNEAGNRMAIFLEVQRIEQFRAKTGRLPTTLDEAGEPLPGLQYQVRSDGGYTVSAPGQPGLQYRSGEDMGAFLGSSASILGIEHGPN